MTPPDSKREDILISACLIIRDEEVFLERCLTSLMDLVDEVVIGDTGSTDRSAEIAREHGAFVFDIPWKDDFAAARNEVIDRARGRWILTIDADECLRKFSKNTLVSALQDASKWAYYCFLCHKRDWTPYRVLRLFRNDRRIRYRGAIHENIRQDLDRILNSEKAGVGSIDLILDHFGYEGDRIDKYRRNFPLVVQELRGDPENTDLIRHLGLIRYKFGQVSLAETEWKKAIDIFVDKERPEPVDSLSFAYLIESLQNRGKPAREFLDVALALFPENPRLYCLNARELLAEGRFVMAIPYLYRLLRWGREKEYVPSIPYPVRIFDAYPHAYMAVCLLMLGRLEDSRFHCDKAMAINPGHPKIESMLRPLTGLYSRMEMDRKGLSRVQKFPY